MVHQYHPLAVPILQTHQLWADQALVLGSYDHSLKLNTQDNLLSQENLKLNSVIQFDTSMQYYEKPKMNSMLLSNCSHTELVKLMHSSN